MSTDLSVDSSSYFPFNVLTNIQMYRWNWLLYPHLG